MTGVEPVQTTNLTTRIGDSAQENRATPARAHPFERPNHSIYWANDFPPALGQDELGACLGLQNSHAVPQGQGIGEINPVDPNRLSAEQPDISLHDAWYNLSFGDEGLEQYAGFEPLALFLQGWRPLN